MKYYIYIVLLLTLTQELLCIESKKYIPLPTPSGGYIHREFIPVISFAGHFLLSSNKFISNDYMNSSSVPMIYNYGFEIGYLKDRKFTEMAYEHRTSIWQYGVMFGTTNFRSTMEEENPHTVFRDDPQQASYKTVRSFTHNTGFLTLRPTASIQFSFLPQKLLLVSGIKVGYRFSEFYEDKLTSNDRTLGEYLPWYFLHYKNDDVQYLVHKDNSEKNYLYGLQLGMTYQFGGPDKQLDYQDDERRSDYIAPYMSVSLGVEYIRANLLGNGVENYMFYGTNIRFTL
ncbi:MAG: hypothetical protein ACK5C0_15105 [Candidatus Kapaibacterium sp.]|jgi:hypothetical protein